MGFINNIRKIIGKPCKHFQKLLSAALLRYKPDYRAYLLHLHLITIEMETNRQSYYLRITISSNFCYCHNYHPTYSV